jgi:hypothetical protein
VEDSGRSLETSSIRRTSRVIGDQLVPSKVHVSPRKVPLASSPPKSTSWPPSAVMLASPRAGGGIETVAGDQEDPLNVQVSFRAPLVS